MGATSRWLAVFALVVAGVLAVGAVVGVVLALLDGWSTGTLLWEVVLALSWSGICGRLWLTLRRDTAARAASPWRWLRRRS